MKMFEYLQFSRRLGRLTSRDAEYWQMMFRKVLKVGEEFEVTVPMNRDVDDVRDSLVHSLQPSNSVLKHGMTGVKEVTFDGSVPHGLEIITAGKRFDWGTFQNMNRIITDNFARHDIQTSYHTGMHIHLLAGYVNNDISELEKNVPEIILANLYQLHRIFAPELYWLASSGNNSWAITRYVLFRRPPFDYTAVRTPMNVIRDEMNEKYGKYQMVNMNYCAINNREVSKFHVEIRHPDTHLSPSYATALVALEVALLTKAIDLSQYGIISMKQDEFNYKKDIFEKFVNLGTGDRESDSSDLMPQDIDDLQYRASAMVRWLKSEIYGISPVAYEILKKISLTPASLMRIKGSSWKDIENNIFTPKLIDRNHIDKLLELIVLQKFTDCENDREWIRLAGQELDITMTKVKDLISQIEEERIIRFDSEIGSMIFKQLV